MLTYYPRLIYQTLLELGYKEACVFKDLPLTAEQLNDEQFRLTLDQHERFMLRVLDLTQDPHLALQIPRHYRPQKANLAIMAIVNSGRITKALHLLSRYNKLITRGFTLSPQTDKGQVCIQLDSHLDHSKFDYFVLGSVALLLNTLFREALGGAALVRRMEMTCGRPGGFDAVAGAYGFDIAFNQAHNRVFFNEQYLDQPLLQADPQTVRMLTEMTERALEEAERETGVSGQVTSLLIEHLSSPPRLGETARILGLSDRGLRRKLAQSGTTYQKLLDGIRLKVATRLLKETSEPLASVAYELGYENASDFGRAFKKWSGMTPLKVRKSA